MRYLVTGSTGFIGRAVVAQLEHDGHVVHPVVVRRPPATGEVGIDLHHRSLDCRGIPGGSLEGIDGALHLAGAPIFAPRWTAAKKEVMRSSRILLGSVLAGALAALERPPTVYVTGSAVGYYGDRGEEELTEASPPGTGFLADLCRSWEAAADPARERGVRVVALRTGVVLGAGGGWLQAQRPLFSLGAGGRLGSGRQWTSFISLADEVAVICRVLLDASLTGPVNATAPYPVRNAALAEALGRELHRPTVAAAPAPVLRVALGRELADEMLLASQRCLPAALSAAGFCFAHPNVEDALRAALEPGDAGARTTQA
jgi:uncharacterized protein (TIGR01777 family)